MKNIRYIILILFSCSFIYSSGQCEAYENNSGCEITICENFFNDEIIGYYLSAIDLESGESNVLLFDYQIDFKNCTDEFIPFNFSINVDIPNLTNGQTEIASGDFSLIKQGHTGTGTVFIKNTDLNSQTISLPGTAGIGFDMGPYTQSITQDEIDEFTNSLLGLGRIPNGNYSFNFTFFDNDVYSRSFNIFVPSYLNLISPGTISIDDTLSASVFIPYPVFQWSGDYCSNCTNYSIRIAEYNPNEHSSLEDAINDISILPNESGFYDIGNQNTAFQYPVIGIQSLNPGNFYVWQIKRSYEATYGTQDEFSEIFIFKMKSFDDIQFEDEVSSEDILSNIKLLIGENKFNEIFGEDGLLFNYKNVSTTMSVKGLEKPIDYIQELIQQLNDGDIEIKEVNVE